MSTHWNTDEAVGIDCATNGSALRIRLLSTETLPFTCTLAVPQRQGVIRAAESLFDELLPRASFSRWLRAARMSDRAFATRHAWSPVPVALAICADAPSFPSAVIEEARDFIGTNHLLFLSLLAQHFPSLTGAGNCRSHPF